MRERPPRSKSRGNSLTNEFRHRIHNRLLLLDGQLAVDRNREAFGGRALRIRERACAVPEVRETRLLVKRQWIVDFVADALLIQMALQPIAIGRSDDELVIDVATVRGLNR